MILVLRGHIRNSFDNTNLLKLLKRIIMNIPDIKIYIHTWKEKSNKISWRNNNRNNSINITTNNEITEDYILDYFKDINKYIKKIFIENDNNIELYGDLSGNISASKAPKKGWKNYIYGCYSITNYLYENLDNKDETIISFRFDILDVKINNTLIFNFNSIVNFINTHARENTTKLNIKYPIEIIKIEKKMGVDNIYIGSLEKLYKLLSYLNFNLDELLEENKGVIHQEHLFLIASKKFEKISKLQMAF